MIWCNDSFDRKDELVKVDPIVDGLVGVVVVVVGDVDGLERGNTLRSGGAVGGKAMAILV